MERDPLWRYHFTARHDHRGGPCDLARYLAAGDGTVRTRCSITPLYRGRNIWCGCWSCTGQRGRKAGNRTHRIQLRAARRDALKTVAADRDTIDIPPPTRICPW